MYSCWQLAKLRLLYFLSCKPQYSLYMYTTICLTIYSYNFNFLKSAIVELTSGQMSMYVDQLSKCMVLCHVIFASNFVGVRAHFQFTTKYMGVKISIEFGLANCSRNHKVQFYIHTWAFYMVQLRESMQHIWKWKYLDVRTSCTRTRPWSSRT